MNKPQESVGKVIASLHDLHAHYPLRRDWLGRPKTWLRAVDGVNLEIHEGEILGLVGESGCGKSTLGRTLLGLRQPTAGRVQVFGQDLAQQSPAALKQLRRGMQLVFQDPFASLNPRETAGAAVQAGLDIHAVGTPAERKARVAELFACVGLAPEMMSRWPHEFSGGQRQRLVIARALALKPKLLVCDEPVSALDVSIQAQILNLLKSLQAQMGLTMVFISHNLAVVEHMADRVAVMYGGRIVELASREALFAAPQHAYTRSLLASVPIPDPRLRRKCPDAELPGLAGGAQAAFA
ncbi:MAG: peptide ABC transporter ATP-binding protein [Methylibium sp.]|nr:peptide ABC transporter ATP-binding protein [Methylibium sp.]